MKAFWMITAGICIAVAAVLMFLQDFSAAFVVAVIGVIAWFLNYRIQLRAVTARADSETNQDIDNEIEEN